LLIQRVIVANPRSGGLVTFHRLPFDCPDSY